MDAWIALFLLVTAGVSLSDGRVRSNYIQAQQLSYDSLSPDNRTLCPETPETKPPERVDTAAHVAELRVEMTAADTELGIVKIHAYIINYGDEHMSGGVEYDKRLQYISGFSGSNGYAIVLENKTAMWTDGRYFTQGDRQMDCNWILMKMDTDGYPSGPEYLIDQLSSGDIVAADPKLLSISTWQDYDEKLGKAGIQMVEVTSELIDKQWTGNDRPKKPNNQIYEHTIEFAGESWQDKVTELRAKVSSMADVLMITALDETAWLFNLRGSDYPTSPLFYSYAMLMQDEVRLYLIDYVQKIVNLTDHLNTNADGTCTGKTPPCVLVLDYNNVRSDLTNLDPKYGNISITPSSSYAIYSSAGDRRQTDLSPMQLMKSVKNEVEERRYYECQVRDSATLVEFMAYLEPQIQAGEEWTEISAVDKLTEYRSLDAYYHMNSFDTISAVGKNAAVIHYRPSDENNARVTTEDVYLLDSGGNYLDGTTDVTRTFHFGTPKAIEIEAYTRVLIGVIDLATTVWPEGLMGSEIDARTRASLWQNGWDYNHGTGHGIGYFLNVHEGPGRIAIGYNADHSPLYAGMFFSDEPGYYEVDQYGIRLETIVGIVEADTPNKFNGKKYLTFNPATLVPFEPHLIDYSMLNQKHREWLNAYNKRVMEETGELLQARDNLDAYAWLEARTQHIPDVPTWGDVNSASQISVGACTLLTSLLAMAIIV